MWDHLASQHGSFKDWMIGIAERVRGEMLGSRRDGQWLGRHGFLFRHGNCHKHTVRFVIIAGDPEDESIGISSVLGRHVQRGHCVRVVSATNGRGDWRQVIKRIRRVVAQRRVGSLAALSTIGVGEGHILYCRYPDGGLYRYLSALFMDLSWVVRDGWPNTVSLTKSFVVGVNLFPGYEWVEYNRHESLGITTHPFLSEGASIHALSQTPREWNAKRQMLECYASENVAARCADQKENIRAVAPFWKQREEFQKMPQSSSPSRRMLGGWYHWLSAQRRRRFDSMALQGDTSQSVGEGLTC